MSEKNPFPPEMRRMMAEMITREQQETVQDSLRALQEIAFLLGYRGEYTECGYHMPLFFSETDPQRQNGAVSKFAGTSAASPDC